jgi:hypothetical protein
LKFEVAEAFAGAPAEREEGKVAFFAGAKNAPTAVLDGTMFSFWLSATNWSEGSNEAHRLPSRRLA